MTDTKITVSLAKVEPVPMVDGRGSRSNSSQGIVSSARSSALTKAGMSKKKSWLRKCDRTITDWEASARVPSSGSSKASADALGWVRSG